MERTTPPRQQFGLPSITIPSEVLFHPHLTRTEKILYGFIRNLASSERGCYATNEWLGGLMGLRNQTISNSIAKLHRYELIIIHEINNTRQIYINPQYPLIFEKICTEQGYKNINMGLLKNLYPPIKKFITKPYNKVNNKEHIVRTKKSSTKSTQKPSAQERNARYLPLAQQLSNIVSSTKHIKHTTLQLKTWANEIRKLVEHQHIRRGRIEDVLDWYADHVGGQYVPVVESGAALRNKFIRLEAAMQRNGHIHNNKPKYKIAYGERYYLCDDGRYRTQDKRYVLEED